MFKYLARIVVISAAVISNSAIASQSASGTINLYSPSGSKLAFKTSGTRTSPPACATDPQWTIAISDENRVMLSSVLSFYTSGRPFEVFGSGTCDGPRETVDYIVSH